MTTFNPHLFASVTAQVEEVRNPPEPSGELIGGIACVPIAGLKRDAFTYVMTYVGWAHDWDADNPQGDYLPVCLGENPDHEALVAEIQRRARTAQLADQQPNEGQCPGHYDDDHALLHGPYSCDGACQTEVQ